jgi:hypothetical protein
MFIAKITIAFAIIIILVNAVGGVNPCIPEGVAASDRPLDMLADEPFEAFFGKAAVRIWKPATKKIRISLVVEVDIARKEVNR